MKGRLLILGLLSAFLLASCSVMTAPQASNAYGAILLNDHFSYDYPAFEQVEVELYDWMYCPNAFNNDEYYQHLDLDWLDPFLEHFDFREGKNDELLTYLDELMDDGKEIQLMEWMLNFEPMIIESLIGE